MSGTTIHDAINALVSLAKTALPDLQVADGPDYDARTSFLAIGWHSEHEPAVNVNRDIADARQARDLEDYDVHNVLSVFRGNAKVADARAQLIDLFNTFDAAIKADPKLGGTVAMARLADYELLPMFTETGAHVAMRITVNVRAWK